MADKKVDPRKIVTGEARLSYCFIWEARKPTEDEAAQGKKPTFQCSVLIPKKDTKTVDAVNKVLEFVKKNDQAVWGGSIPKANFKLPLRDGDTEREDDAYKGHWFINCSSQGAPEIVERDGAGQIVPITDKTKVFSGVYARVSIRFYAFNKKGNKGIAAGLGNILYTRDGESLSGRESAEKEFADLDDESTDDNPMFN